MRETPGPVVEVDLWAPSRADGRRSWDRLRRDLRAMTGASLLVLMGLAAILAGVLSTRPPDLPDPESPLRPPLSTHLLGTDYLGRDTLSRLLFAARYTLVVAGLTAAVAVTLGAVLGALAGYHRGAVDTLISRSMDVMLSLPVLPTLIVLGSVIDITPTRLIGGIALFQWMTVGRLVRGEFLSLREREFVTAARSLGVPPGRIMWRHLLPNAMAPLPVALALVVANAILIESALSFLGCGIPPPTPTWGNMLTSAQSYVRIAPWLAVFPGLLITLCVTSVVFVGDALRDAFDPRLVE